MGRAIPLLVVVAIVIGLVVAPTSHAASLEKPIAADRDGIDFKQIIAERLNENPSTSSQASPPTTQKVPSPNVGTPSSSNGTVLHNANLRSGPGTNYPVVGKVGAGQRVGISRCNDACTWYQLDTGNWIAAFLVAREDGNITRQVAPQNLPALAPTNKPQANAEKSPLLQDLNLPQSGGRTIRPAAPQNLPALEPVNKTEANAEKSPQTGTQNLPALKPANTQKVNPTPNSNPSWIAKDGSFLPQGQSGNLEASPSSILCSCSADLFDCQYFASRNQAQACFAYCAGQGWGDVHLLDLDKDGIACEWLPD